MILSHSSAARHAAATLHNCPAPTRCRAFSYEPKGAVSPCARPAMMLSGRVSQKVRPFRRSVLGRPHERPAVCSIRKALQGDRAEVRSNTASGVEGSIEYGGALRRALPIVRVSGHDAS